MRHDYDLPPDWNAKTEEERSRWMTQERCRRQFQRQQTPAKKEVNSEKRRIARKMKAHPATVPVEK